MSLRRTQFNSSRGTGRYGLTGEIDVTWEPSTPVSGAPTVILLHGLLGTSEYFLDISLGSHYTDYPKLLMMGPLLASYGCRAIAIDGGLRSGGAAPDSAFTHFGNPSHTARLETLRTSIGVSRLSFIGISMGGYSALQYAVNHPSTTGAIVGYSAVTDAVEFYNDNSNPAYMAEAWGVTSPDPLPGAADITSHANLVGIPWLAYHCQDDASVSYSSAQSMVSHIGSSARLVDFPTGDHAGTLQQADFEEVVSWIWDYS